MGSGLHHRTIQHGDPALLNSRGGGRGRQGVAKSAPARLTDKAERKERNRQVLLDHLADFVYENQQWLGGKFPTRDYLSSAGRIDLAEAIRKLGGPAKVAHMFGLSWGTENTAAFKPSRKREGAGGSRERHGAGSGHRDQQDQGTISVLDREKLEASIAMNVDDGHAFMVEHTTSKTPMKETFWTLWKPPISAGTTAETVERILTEAQKCSDHHPVSYVRICAFDKGDFSKKITFIVHFPTETSQ